MGDAFVIDSDRPGGAQRVTYDLVKEIHKSDCTHRLLYFREALESPAPFVRNIYIYGLSARYVADKIERLIARILGRPYRFLMSPFYSYQLYRQIKQDAFGKIYLVSDVAFSHFWFLKYLHPNVVIILHSKKSIQYRIQKSRFLKLLFRWSVAGVPLIAISKSIADDLSLFDMPGAQVSIRYNFTDYDRVIELAAQTHHSQMPESPFYLYVGRLSGEKNLEELISQFITSGSKSTLVLCGDGPARADLEHFVRTKDIDNVLFMGHVDNPYPLIKEAKALLLNSRREGFPTVVKEALLLDTPVISNRSFYELEDLLGPANIRFIACQGNPMCQIIFNIEAGNLFFEVKATNISKYSVGDVNAFR